MSEFDNDSQYQQSPQPQRGRHVRQQTQQGSSQQPAQVQRQQQPQRTAHHAQQPAFTTQAQATRPFSGRPASNGVNGGAGAPGNLYPIPDLSKTEDVIRVRKKRPKHTVRNVVIIVLVALVVIVGIGAGAAALYLNSLNQALSFDNQEEAESLKKVLEPVTAETKDKPFYMLVLGSDAREGDTASRSDVIILTRVDPANGQITLVSIPRDTMIDLPGHGRQKINAAYAFGGAAGAVEAVSSFAGVPISHYAEIHFKELEALVDRLGGVWVNVPVSNDQTGSSNSGMVLNAGEQLLSGQQALAFARERYGYMRGDFQRADNQRILAEAIIKKVLAVSPLELPGTIQGLAECVSTDFGITDIVELAQKFQSAGDITFYSGMAPSSTMMLDGISYVVTEYPGWTEMMELVDEGRDPNGVSSETASTSTDDANDSDTAESGEADDLAAAA